MKNWLKDKHRKDMSRSVFKEYHRPYMAIETFVPNEFVAGCVHPNVQEISGQFCFDLNHNGYFEWEPDERGYLSYPLGIYKDSFYAGNFQIEEQGRYFYNGGESYLYVGPGTIDDPGLTITEYDYSNTNLFAPIYYANLVIYRPTEPAGHRTTFFYTGPGDFGGVTNAS